MRPQLAAAANPLGTEKVGKLIRQFATPSIVGLLVASVYNVTDQVFIGQGIGMLGNAAANVAFPFSILATATALLLGIGTAANNNLNQGAGRPKLAARQVATGLSLLIICGISVATIAGIFLPTLLQAFGATPESLPYALAYARIIVFGLPFVIFTIAGGHLIRSDGSPKYAMLCLVSGAVINIMLNPLFIFGLGWGMSGAALATVSGQLIAALVAARYLFFKMKTVKLEKKHFRPRWLYIKPILVLGAASFFNQLIMMVVQIVVNNTLRHYGELSVYGSEIPLAVAGVVIKISMLFFAFSIGIAQGCQPIFGYNYGAGNYARVKETYKKAVFAVIAISLLFFTCFQLFPRQIVSIFGEGNELYFQFAERFFRIYMMFCFLVGLQPLTVSFFTAIGKAKYGILLSLTRQGLLLLPLMIIFPLIWGIEGLMYAAPIADFSSAILAVFLVTRQLKLMMQREQVTLSS